MTPDPELIGRYCDQHDEAAFAELVRRHVKLVYGTALRLVGGDTPLAEDVTQAVFTDLARKANQVRGHETVAGWLHTGARFAAAKAVRAERLRRTREQEASTMHDTTTTIDDNNWAQMRPLIDEAVGRLGDLDRNSVLLRFFQEKSYREIGELMGTSEDAARMRIERALERLRGQFARRGLTASAALIASALGANAAMAPAADFSATLAQKSMVGAVVHVEAGKFSAIKILALLAGASALAATVTVSFAPWKNAMVGHESPAFAPLQRQAEVNTPTAAPAPGTPVALLGPVALTPVLASAVPAVATLWQEVAATKIDATTAGQPPSDQTMSPNASTPTTQEAASPMEPNTDNPSAPQPPASPAAMVTGIAIFESANQTTPDFLDTSGVLNDKTITAIANGGDHKLALCSDGTLVSLQRKVTGSLLSNRGRTVGIKNSNGRIVDWVPIDNQDDQNISDQSTNMTANIIPTLVDASNIPKGEKFTAIAAGAGSNIAISSDGAVYVWGGGQAIVANRQGRTPIAPSNSGNGRATADRHPVDAVAIPTLLNSGALKDRRAVAIGVGAGGLFGLALCSDGALVTWGDNSCFQMGDDRGGLQERIMSGGGSDPQLINNKGDLQGKTISAISTSWYDGLVLCSDGTMIEWGAPSATPIAVNTNGFLKGKIITDIAAGGAQSGLVLCSDNTLAGWSVSTAPEELERLPATGQRGGVTRGIGRGSMPRGAISNKSDSAGALNVLDGKTITAISVRGNDGYLILCSDGTLATWSGGRPVLQDRAGVLKDKTILAIAPDMVLFQEPDNTSEQDQ